MNWKLFLILPLVFLINSCASQKSEEQDIGSESDSLLIDDLIPLLPSPAEFLDMVNGTGIVYQDDIISSIVSPDIFLLYRNQALNFGVYLTDFSYLLLFEKQSESIKYLNHIQEMSKKLGVENYFNDEFFNMLLANLSHPDLLKKISLHQSSLFFNKMNDIDNKDLVLYITTGSMIEAMHIASKTTDDKHITDEVINRTIDISYIFDVFYLHFKLSRPNKGEVKQLVDDINELNEIFTSMAIVPTSKAIRKENNIVIKSDVAHNINEYNISEMKVLVDLIRGKIINQKY